MGKDTTTDGTSGNITALKALPLDVPLKITAAEEAFLAEATGISDHDELFKHITEVQIEAYTSIHPFGTDLRKVARDGYPVDALVGLEVEENFINLGYLLFRDTRTSPFTPRQLLHNIFSAPRSEPADCQEHSATRFPDASNLASLGQLGRSARAIHAASLFHLFDRDTQKYLARRIAGLLVLREGSTIFGSQYAAKTEGSVIETVSGGGAKVYAHSPESWKRLWEDVLEGYEIEVKAELKELGGGTSLAAPIKLHEGDQHGHLMIWSVKILS
ncbi:hypothetical protein P7C70_g256, partial [Phenoliferia sp. Uapishka_3]